MEELPPGDQQPARPATDPWPRHLAERGHPGARRIGAGVEGVVYALGGGRVAKVWTGRPPAGLALTRRLYADIAKHPLPFVTPEIFEVAEYEGVVVTYERELPGASVHGDSAHEPFARELPPHHRDVLLTVLRGLASVPATEAMRTLTVQGDDRPLWQDRHRFPSALAALVARGGRHRGTHPAARRRTRLRTRRLERLPGGVRPDHLRPVRHGRRRRPLPLVRRTAAAQ
ncbi:hypothetical protein ACIRJS_07325 [Streptomyces sp. NPDC102340]|uniref:hypothetical protein n=1 Tax=unclassified Streptomyces TaxID=2593676 RepID=UPI003821AD8E